MTLRTSLLAAIPFLLASAAVASEDGNVVRDGDRITATWPIAPGEFGRLVLNAAPGRPLIEVMGIASSQDGPAIELMKDVDPAIFLTVGTRSTPRDHPPGMSAFNVFFDNPPTRPSQGHRSKLEPKVGRIVPGEGRLEVTIDGLTVGPFSGAWRFAVYNGSRLVQIEAVVRTEEGRRAIVYDSGLVAGPSRPWRQLAWTDTQGTVCRAVPADAAEDRALAVRNRAIVAECGGGAVACFPPPHQFFYPRDFTDNQATAWFGRGHRKLEDRHGFGIRQTETGGGNYTPWFNAPPGTEQKLGCFYLLTRGTAEDALRETLKYTHGDRFEDLPGFKTLTSHWHMALTVAAMAEREKGGPRSVSDVSRIFRDMNVNVVHLAEFHGDGHPQDPGPVRLAELAAMFEECRRLSGEDLLFLPGEEANVHIGGHWLYLFPRPVSWIMKRGKDEPFAAPDSKYGTIYRVGSIADMVRLLEAEHGLAWTAHPRIKSSNLAPDQYREEAFYKSGVWLGATWKAMPADLSRERLGERCLNLLDDMANWGGKKYALGEVDVFKIDPTHELYGHMNVNYVRMDRLPKFDEDWSPVLDAIRGGKFFVTTGEVLMPRFAISGKSSGDTLKADRGELTLDLRWTFPMSFAEVISGDGRDVYRERIDLGSSRAFGKTTITRNLDLKGRKWVRVEAWDVACNGAISQPVWIEPGEPR